MSEIINNFLKQILRRFLYLDMYKFKDILFVYVFVCQPKSQPQLLQSDKLHWTLKMANEHILLKNIRKRTEVAYLDIFTFFAIYYMEYTGMKKKYIV